MPNKFNCRRVLGIFLLVTFSVIFLLSVDASRRTYDGDIWIHLEYGKHFIENRTLSVDHSIFSWTPATRAWTYVTWIGSAAIYAVYKCVGLDAVMILPFAILVAILILYILFLRSIGSSFSALSMGLFFSAAVFFYLPIVKPAIFSSFLFAACVAVYFSSRNFQYRLFWCLPPLFVIWVNTHGAFIFGLFFLCLAFTAEFLVAWRAKTLQADKKYLKSFFLALILSFLVLGINPHGFGYLAGISRDILLVDAIDPQQNISEYRNLWGSLDATMNPRSVGISWFGIFMLASYGLLALIDFKRGRRPNLTNVVLLLTFFAIGMLYFRLFAFYALVWLFAISCLIAREKHSFNSFKLALASLLIMCYFIGNQLNFHFLEGNSFTPFKHDIENFYPVDATDFLKRHGLPHQLIHDYGTGGYLLWKLYPEYRVFIDPRAWPYRKDILTDCFALEDSKTEAEVRAILQRYPEARTAVFNLSFRNLSQIFLLMPEWKLVYFDHAVVIFARKDPQVSSIQPDLAHQRFATLKKPLPLMNLFFIYVSLGHPDSAQMIRTYYKNNVSSYYLYKNSTLEVMDAILPAALKKLKRDTTEQLNKRKPSQ
jgi:hypothetical protein